MPSAHGALPVDRHASRSPGAIPCSDPEQTGGLARRTGMRAVFVLPLLAACGGSDPLPTPPAPTSTPQIVSPTPDPIASCTGLALGLVVDRSGSMSGLPIQEARNAVVG